MENAVIGNPKDSSGALIVGVHAWRISAMCRVSNESIVDIHSAGDMKCIATLSHNEKKKAFIEVQREGQVKVRQPSQDQ